MQDTIFINDLAVTTLIGILPHERVQKQKLILDVSLTTDFATAAESDDMRDGISYAEIADTIVEFATEAEYGLLERFGQELINRLFSDFPAKSIELKITKPGAVAHTRNIGIHMQRQRPATTD
ncbi:dihydroneopterin aldolase [Cardiobacteriaceae bacterium TAE3-ERU3]|nr:dihydroneopterin aldolase [Cardiobacteriaceae bacterium TAE3-ERU3]